MSRLIALVSAWLLAAALPAAAAPRTASGDALPCTAFDDAAWLAPARADAIGVWRVAWLPGPPQADGPLALTPPPLETAAAQARPRPVAIEYSHGYDVRRTIHKWASLATVPLFVAEFAVGQSLYNSTANSGGKRGVHAALAGGIAGLFAANSVTGVWNLWEGRKDPNGRGKRMLHGILMLAADAGFLATGATAPEGEHERDGRLRPLDTSGRSRHRAVALTSMGTAVAGYLVMLLWRD